MTVNVYGPFFAADYDTWIASIAAGITAASGITTVQYGDQLHVIENTST